MAQLGQFLVSPGEQCFTSSEAEKLKIAINKLGGAKVLEVRGIYFYYTHLISSDDQDATKVSHLGLSSELHPRGSVLMKMTDTSLRRQNCRNFYLLILTLQS